MEFTLTITGTVTPDLAPVLLGLTGGSLATTTASSKPAAIKQTATKTDTAAGPAAPAAPAQTADTTTEDSSSTEKLTIEAVRELATQKAEHNLPAIKTLFKEFGVKRAVDLQPEQYAAFYAKVKAL